MLDLHQCEQSDWDKFPPPADSSKDTIEKIKKDPNRGMLCLDWDQAELEIFGHEKDLQH